MPARQGPSPLLLVLAALGGFLLLYRLGSTRSRFPPTQKRPAHVEFPAEDSGAVWRRRVVAVGDLHGDLNNAQKVLRMANIIDDSAKWIGGKDILVQTGDIVDRGTDTIALYRMFQRLRGEARDAGGDLYSILGNHEIMNAIGDWRYVTELDIKTFGGAAARQEALSDEGWLGQEWLANYTVTARVPLTPYPSPSHHLAFSHGSLHPTLPLLTPFPSSPNALAHSLLTRALAKPMPLPYPPNPYPGLPANCTEDEKTLYGSDGVVWWRGLAMGEDEEKVCEWAEVLKKRLGVRRVIGGHTPNFEKVVSRCGGDVVIIDTGISKAYGGVLAALEIIYTLYPSSSPPSHGEMLLPSTAEASTLVSRNGKKKFRELEVVNAIYEERKDELSRKRGEVEFEML